MELKKRQKSGAIRLSKAFHHPCNLYH